MFPPVYTADFLLLSRNVMIYLILGTIDDLSLLLFDNAFMYWKKILVGDTFSPERIISC